MSQAVRFESARALQALAERVPQELGTGRASQLHSLEFIGLRLFGTILVVNVTVHSGSETWGEIRRTLSPKQVTTLLWFVAAQSF